MRPDERDAGYLWDMLKSAREVESFTRGVTFDELAADLMRTRALERSMETIGEAAGHVSVSLREAHPEVPWRKIVGQRHVIAHEYGGVELQGLWTVATNEIPTLIRQIELILPSAP